MRPPVVESRWAARISRARALAGGRPEARDALEFFAGLTAEQQTLSLQYSTAHAALPVFLRWLERNAPAPIAEAAWNASPWPQLLDGYPTANPQAAFCVEALLHAFPPDSCPGCSGPPVVSLLRDAAHGSRRSYVCGTCLKESPASRLGCVACGETTVEKLAVYRTDALDPARIDACDSCRTYLKTIDLTKDATACPIADDLGSVTLDLWAREQGYHRPRPNLLRL